MQLRSSIEPKSALVKVRVNVVTAEVDLSGVTLPIIVPHRELDRAAAKEPAALSHLLNNLAALAPALVSAQKRIGLKRVNDTFKFSLVVAYGFSPHQVRC